MKLPSSKKILREDLKDAPSWISGIIDPVNSFMENVYQALNRNITFTENTASFVKELTYKTPSTYPTMDQIEFSNDLKTKAIGVVLLQAVERSTYRAAPGPCFAPWIEDDGQIILSPITGLEADKIYTIRLLVI